MQSNDCSAPLSQRTAVESRAAGTVALSVGKVEANLSSEVFDPA